MFTEKERKKRTAYRPVVFFLAILLAGELLCGCSAAGERESGSASGLLPGTEAEVPGMEPAPVLDYELPVLLPHILLNRIGYQPDSAKIAVIRGEQLPRQFELVDAATGEVVYTGYLTEQEYDKETKEYNSYGDFSDFAKEGEYYVECDIIGRSYSFVIKEDIYTELMEGALAKLAARRGDLTREDITEACRGVSALLLSYELYAPVYDGENGGATQPALITEIKAYIEWLLNCQDEQTGAILTDGEPDYEKTGWLSAALAKFSYTYQKFDSAYATVCLQAADRAWRCLDKQEVTVSAGVRFYAAAELYRATGQYQYHAAVKTLGEKLLPEAGNEAQVFGTLTYAATKRKVDIDLCGSLLNVLLEEAEVMAQMAKEDIFMAGSSLSKESLPDILWDMLVVSAVDYIITNHEYATIIENNHNYLSGQNESALCYTGGIYGGAAIGESCADTAAYIMMLSEIMSHEQEE